MLSKVFIKKSSLLLFLSFLFTISLNQKWNGRGVSSIVDLNERENLNREESLEFRLERIQNQKKFPDKIVKAGELVSINPNPHILKVIENCKKSGGLIEWIRLNKEYLETCKVNFREVVFDLNSNPLEGISSVYYSPRYLEGEVKRVWLSDDFKSSLNYELFSSLK